MSSTISTPSTTSSTIPTPSASNKTEIPSSTVISIGLGFVAFTVGLLFVLIGFRLWRIRQRMLADRQSGATMTFGQAWEREGGIFGFLTGAGGESYSALYPGAASLQERMDLLRRRQEFLLGFLGGEVPRPKMYEVPVSDKGSLVEQAVDEFEPFALQSSAAPPFTDRAKPSTELPEPLLSLCLLISMPCETLPSKSSSSTAHSPAGNPIQPADEEEWPDLPEVMIGVTDLAPYITLSEQQERASMEKSMSSRHRQSYSAPRVSREEVEGKDKLDGAVVQELEYSLGSVTRRARWARADMGKWRIEGL